MIKNIQLQSTAKGKILSAIFTKNKSPKGAILLLHNTSGNMNNPIIKMTAEEAGKRGYDSLRFNYHYVEGIGSKKATWEDIVLDSESAFAKLKELCASDYYLIGKSLGGLMALYLAIKYPRDIKGLGIYALPKAMLLKYFNLENLKTIKSNVVIFHGEKDRFGTPNEIKICLSKYINNLIVEPIMNGEHSFEKTNSEKENKKITNQLLDFLFIKK